MGRLSVGTSRGEEFKSGTASVYYKSIIMSFMATLFGRDQLDAGGESVREGL